jgi:hypothetical protein
MVDYEIHSEPDADPDSELMPDEVTTFREVTFELRAIKERIEAVKDSIGTLQAIVIGLCTVVLIASGGAALFLFGLSGDVGLVKGRLEGIDTAVSQMQRDVADIKTTLTSQPQKTGALESTPGMQTRSEQ